MMPLDYVLAVAMIVAPCGERDQFHESYERVRPTVQSVALDMEIMDPREVRFVLTRREDYAGDVELITRRYADLYGAPSLADCVRLPDRGLVTDLLSFNRAYRQHVERVAENNPQRYWELWEVKRETDRLYQVWDLVRDARCGYYYVTVRRQAMRKLMDAIGEEAYYNCDLPPHVPTWRFATIP